MKKAFTAESAKSAEIFEGFVMNTDPLRVGQKLNSAGSLCELSVLPRQLRPGQVRG
jgi:hypothetical protein